MTDIDFFMQGTVGIDILNSHISDIRYLSKYIENNYPNCISDSSFTYIGDHEKNLEGYFVYLKNDNTKEPWQVLVYEPETKCFNGYRGESFADYVYENEVMTAEEIARYIEPIKNLEITENELSEILYG